MDQDDIVDNIIIRFVSIRQSIYNNDHNLRRVKIFLQIDKLNLHKKVNLWIFDSKRLVEIDLRFSLEGNSRSSKKYQTSREQRNFAWYLLQIQAVYLLLHIIYGVVAEPLKAETCFKVFTLSERPLISLSLNSRSQLINVRMNVI